MTGALPALTSEPSERTHFARRALVAVAGSSSTSTQSKERTRSFPGFGDVRPGPHPDSDDRWEQADWSEATIGFGQKDDQHEVDSIGPLNKFSESFVLNNISPIQTNNGNAVKVHDELVPQMVVAIASPTGLVVKSIMPIAETAIILKATQTPDPSKNNSREIKKIVKNTSFITI